MKKTFIIIAGIIILIGIGIGVYFLFFANRAHVVIAPQKTTPSAFPIASNNKTPATIAGITGGERQTQNNIPGEGAATGMLPRLVQISKGPVVPSLVSLDLNSTTTASTTQATASSTTPVIVQYIEQQSGNIYQYNSSTGKQTRTSNKTIPGIRSAAWLPDGSLAYVQYLSHTGSGSGDVSTYALPRNGTDGFFLPQGLSEVLADGNDALLAVSSSENGSIIKKANKNASNVYTAFQTPLSAIRVMVAGLKNYIVYTKPSAGIGGYVFLEHADTGILTPIAGPQNGLVALANHAGTNVLVSYISSGGDMRTELVSTQTRTVIQLPISTIADKCVWSQNDSDIYCGVPQNPPHDSYPDSWYQGTTSFTDQMWEINVVGRYAKFLFDFSKEEGKPLDAIALSVDSKQQVLSFVNKRTRALWAYRLQQ